jgi:hypothetical protein
MSDEALADDVERLNIDRVQVPVFYAAWTVVDCFRVRNKSGLDVALERCATAGVSTSSRWTTCGAAPPAAAWPT